MKQQRQKISDCGSAANDLGIPRTSTPAALCILLVCFLRSSVEV